MKQQAPRVVVPPHPGPMRMNNSDPGVYGILIAIAFAALGIVGLPLYRPFLEGAVCFGVVVALLLYLMRKTKKKPSGMFPCDESPQEGTSSERFTPGDHFSNRQLMHFAHAFGSLPISPKRCGRCNGGRPNRRSKGRRLRDIGGPLRGRVDAGA
jgi:hypothetical protein